MCGQTGLKAARVWGAFVSGRSGGVHPPGEHQTQQGADEDEHLVEHGRVGPLDGAMEVILQAGEPVISVELMIDSS